MITSYENRRKYFNEESSLERFGTVFDESEIRLFSQNFNFSLSCNPGLRSLNALIKNFVLNTPFQNLDLLSAVKRCGAGKSEICNGIHNYGSESYFKKRIIQGAGGLCYPVNMVFGAFLFYMGFDAWLIPGVAGTDVTDISDSDFNHIAIFVRLNGLEYIIDCGDGKPYFQAFPLRKFVEKKTKYYYYKTQYDECSNTFAFYYLPGMKANVKLYVRQCSSIELNEIRSSVSPLIQNNIRIRQFTPNLRQIYGDSAHDNKHTRIVSICGSKRFNIKSADDFIEQLEKLFPNYYRTLTLEEKEDIKNIAVNFLMQ